MKNRKLFVLTECSLMVALATVLSFCKVYEAPLGGAVTLLSMLPIIFISFKHGIAWGLGSGFVYSITQLIFGMSVLAYVPTALGVIGSVLFDYIIPFTLLGIAGITMLSVPEKKSSVFAAVVGGTLLAITLRFTCHLFSGAVIWYEITKQGEWNDYVFKYGMWTYSFIYNISYLGPDGALALIASPVIIRLMNIPFFGKKSY
ncbi:MAG: energy-coupled thiamine transporter ThiT [Eubacteriales bacterium]|nr:energy-coupled thiamine transporter ThiT [Eubacteriales bacterium]